MSLQAATAMEPMARLPLIAFEELGLRNLVVVAPHPDDESLGCGGLMAMARANDVTVRIVVISDGSGSHPNSAAYPPARLRRLREEETVAAVGELGVPPDAVAFLRQPDSRVQSNGPEAVAAVAAIAAIARACAADLMTVTWQHDPHCDHRASFVLAQTACHQFKNLRLLAYPIWAFKLPTEQMFRYNPLRGFRLSIENYLPAKRRAIAAHRSQLTRLIDPAGFQLQPTDLAHFDLPYETYIATR